MGAYYDEVEIEDFVWDEEKRVYHYPCPCGDRFEISRGQLRDCEDIAVCPSCSLIVRVIYDPLDWEDYEEEEEEEDEEGENQTETSSDSDSGEYEDALDLDLEKLKINGVTTVVA